MSRDLSIIIVVGDDPAGLAASLGSAQAQAQDAEVIVAGAITAPAVAEALVPYETEVTLVAADDPAAARNAGVDRASRDNVLVLEAHELLTVGAADRHCESLADEGTVGSYGRVAVHDGQVRIRPERGRGGNILGRLLKERHLIPATGALAWRRSALGEAPFNPDLRTATALRLDLALQLARAGDIAFHPLVVAERPSERRGQEELEELVKVFLAVLYSADPLDERGEERARFRLARQLVALGKHHYRAGEHKKAGTFFDQAVKTAPGYFRGRRYQFLNFLKTTFSRV